MAWRILPTMLKAGPIIEGADDICLDQAIVVQMPVPDIYFFCSVG